MGSWGWRSLHSLHFILSWCFSCDSTIKSRLALNPLSSYFNPGMNYRDVSPVWPLCHFWSVKMSISRRVCILSYKYFRIKSWFIIENHSSRLRLYFHSNWYTWKILKICPWTHLILILYLKKVSFIYLLCVCVCACVPAEVREGIRSSGVWLTEDCELPKIQFSERTSRLLTTEPSSLQRPDSQL